MLQKISIIIPVLNAEATIENAIISVLHQTYPEKELIIIDGGSTDSTLTIINKFKNRINCIISENDNGIYHAINKGIQYANGNWIYILGADDMLHDENVLQNIFNTDLTKYAIIFGNVNNISIKHALVRKKHICKLSFSLIWRNTLHQQGTFYNKNKLNIHFNTCYKILADYDFHLKLFNQKVKQKYVDITVSDCLAQGISKKFNKQLYSEELKIKRENLNTLLYILNIPWILFKYLIKSTSQKISV